MDHPDGSRPSAWSHCSAIVAAAAMLLVASTAVAAAGIADSPGEWIWSFVRLRWAFFGPVLLGGYVFVLARGTRPRQVGLAVLLGLAALALLDARFGAPVPWLFKLLHAVGFVGAAGIALALPGAIARRREDQKEFVAACMALVWPSLALSLTTILHVTTSVLPLTADWFLFVFDGLLGAQPSFVVARAVRASFPLLLASAVAYQFLPVVLGLVAGRRLFARVGSDDVIVATLAVGTLGFLLYFLLPGIGPASAFGALFPGEDPVMLGDPVPMAGGATVRNAMPSLHTAWMVLAIWASRGDSVWVRLQAVVMTVLTLLGALALGEHYVIDFVAGVPVALAGAAAAGMLEGGMRTRWGVAVGAIAVTLSWFAIVRWGWPWTVDWPRVSWFLALSTAGGCLALGERWTRPSS